MNNLTILRNVEFDPDTYLNECYDIILDLAVQVEEAHEKIRIMMLERNGSCTAGEED